MSVTDQESTTEKPIVQLSSPEPRIFVFIDAENTRNAAEKHGYNDIDYSKLYAWLKKKKKVEKIFIYAGIEQGDSEKEQRYTALSRQDCIISLKTVVAYKQQPWDLKTRCPHCKKEFLRRVYKKDKKKANCDTELTLDITRYACEDAYDEAIIFSGDGDFLKVYEYLITEKNKKVTVFSSMEKHYKMTNTKIKEAANKGVLTLRDLGGILPHYGLKIPVTS